jgi:2-furoate---CoA ligase
MNLALTLLGAAERRADAEALVDDEMRCDYEGLQARAARLAGGLAELGLERGGRLCVLLKNRHETVALYWATQWLGAWFVPLNFRLGAEEVRYCVDDAEASVVAFEEVSAEAAAACRGSGRVLLSVNAGGDADASFDEIDPPSPAPGHWISTNARRR